MTKHELTPCAQHAPAGDSHCTVCLYPELNREPVVEWDYLIARHLGKPVQCGSCCCELRTCIPLDAGPVCFECIKLRVSDYAEAELARRHGEKP